MGRRGITDENGKEVIKMSEDKSTKVCIIENSRFSYFLKVDGETVPFQGSYNADYFIKHYKGLGYTVKYIDNSD